MRYVWSSWSGGGATSHTVAPTTNKTYTAAFMTQYYLTMSHGTGGTVTLVGGEAVEQLFRSVPLRLAATASATGVGAEQAPFLGRIIRPQLRWANRPPRRPLSLTVDVNTSRVTCGSQSLSGNSMVTTIACFAAWKMGANHFIGDQLSRCFRTHTAQSRSSDKRR